MAGGVSGCVMFFTCPCLTPRSACCCLCCASTPRNNVLKSPGRCHRAPALNPKTPGRGPARSPDWMTGWDRSLCLESAVWRTQRSLTPASLRSACPHLGKALEGCRGRDAGAGEDGEAPDCRCPWAGCPGWRSQCLDRGRLMF